MTHQGLLIPYLKKYHISFGKTLPSSLTLPASLTALLLVSGGSMLLPTQVNAGIAYQQSTASRLVAQAPATGSVIYVNPQTGQDSTGAGNAEATPYKTITNALNQAQPGTVIQLAPGTYNKDSGEQFPLLIKQGVTLRGDESSKGQAVLITGSGFYVSPTFARQNVTIRADKDSTITGITVTNPENRGTGVWVESTNPTITNSTFTNSIRDGVFVTGTGNPKIENNVFVQNKGNGISVVKSAQGVIRNNLFQNTGFGLSLNGNSTPLVTENQILQNKDGIYISESAKPVLRRNVIQKNTQDGIVVIGNALPDLGTTQNPGGNLISKNARYEVNNATKTKILAINNEIDAKRISGPVDFVFAKAEPLSGGAVAFKDVPAGYWAKTYIEALASKNIIAGFPDGSFKPNEPVTRAQFAAIVTKAFQPQAKTQGTQFTDVKSNFWAYEAIQSASKGGFVSGYPDLTFKPAEQIQRVQALVSLANGLGLNADNQNVLSIYSDASQIPQYATSSVAAATARQLVVNYPTLKQLNPTREATRADVAAFVYQAMVNAGRAQVVPSPYLVKVP